MCEDQKGHQCGWRTGSGREIRDQDMQVLLGYSKESGFYSKESKEAFEGLNIDGYPHVRSVVLRSTS